MSDSKRQVKMVAERALASLVERAKRLQLTSVSSVQLNRFAGEQRPQPKESETEPSASAAVGGQARKSAKGSQSGHGSATQRSLATARKQRKMDAEPSPPPPPSPRELGVIAELRDDFYQTDQLLDQMLADAHRLHRDMICCTQHQRDLALVQQIEMETTTRSLDSLFGALNEDLGRNDLREVMERCNTALKRSKQRLCSALISEPSDSNSESNCRHSNDSNSQGSSSDGNLSINRSRNSNKITAFEGIGETMKKSGVVQEALLILPLEQRESSSGDCDGSTFLAKR
ncbi:hypothetical protein AWZ03_010876 [Drosophila navojoa]|uniref:Uncharacterized protein n=1 Tax=Drosophila navojoa TaxID=7232 RepID=A0A484B3R3_DRONA|nr:uncharacterized protein LOC108656450 [Drosophila navojoa]TDG42710.1 hypothetical protein AWZ03_010876 [Drosophila navojoa]